MWNLCFIYSIRRRLICLWSSPKFGIGGESIDPRPSATKTLSIQLTPLTAGPNGSHQFSLKISMFGLNSSRKSRQYEQPNFIENYANFWKFMQIFGKLCKFLKTNFFFFKKKRQLYWQSMNIREENDKFVFKKEIQWKMLLGQRSSRSIWPCRNLIASIFPSVVFR